MIWALLIALLAAPLVAEALRVPVENRRKGGVPGRMADLAAGKTHILADGPEDGPPLVLIHGLTTPSSVWAGITPLLVQAGYRVIRYDLYGRGYSDRPKGRQDGAFFLAQLEAVLAEEGVARPYTLAGYSMGGAIATLAAARDSSDIDAVIVLAPTGLAKTELPWVTGVPIFDDWVLWLFGPRILPRRAAKVGASALPDLAEREALQTRTRGFLPAVQASIRRMVNRDLSTEHTKIGIDGPPLLAIWAEGDEVIPLSSAGRLAELNPDAWHHQIAGAGHAVPLTRPGEVAAEMLRFLADVSRRSGG